MASGWAAEKAVAAVVGTAPSTAVGRVGVMVVYMVGETAAVRDGVWAG